MPTPWLAPPPPPAGANGFAIVSLVLGLLGLVCAFAVLSLIFGCIALSQISKSGQKGRGMAICGIVASGVWLVGLTTMAVTGTVLSADQDSRSAYTQDGASTPAS
jgi:hypothetical protein